LETLQFVDKAAAEDTRHSRVLFTHFNIKTPLHACHAFNEEKKGDFFVRLLLAGENIALISDAGTPCISDPGYRLISRAAQAGIEVVPVCGASAVVAALSVSGFDASQFTFIGFWPRKKKEQTEAIQALITRQHPTVFYESPQRITKTLAQLTEADPEALLCLCNDLTKKFERTYRGTACEISDEISENPNAKKGEYTCVILPTTIKKAPPAEISSEGEALSLEAQLVDLMVRQDCDVKSAAQHLRDKFPKYSKKEIYGAMLRLKDLF